MEGWWGLSRVSLQAKRCCWQLSWYIAGETDEGPQVGSNSIEFSDQVRALCGPGQKGGLQRSCEWGRHQDIVGF